MADWRLHITLFRRAESGLIKAPRQAGLGLWQTRAPLLAGDNFDDAPGRLRPGRARDLRGVGPDPPRQEVPYAIRQRPRVVDAKIDRAGAADFAENRDIAA